MEFVKYLRDGISIVPYYSIILPLRTLYFGGPRLWGWGGWEGISFQEICAQLTQVPAKVWENSTDCRELVERKFQTFLISLGAGTYIFLVFKLVNYIWLRYFILGPLLKEFKDHMKKS